MKIIRLWAYPEPDEMEVAELPTKASAIIFKWMFHFASHERIGILFEDAQTNARAKVDSLAAIYGTGIIGWFLDGASTGSLVFRQGGGGSFHQFSVFVMM